MAEACVEPITDNGIRDYLQQRRRALLMELKSLERLLGMERPRQ